MRPRSLLLALPLLLLASTASAGDAPSTAASNDDGYAYDFQDDVLAANPNAAQGSLIRLRTHIVRRTLIRPRAHFVPELLKSVEQI